MPLPSLSPAHHPTTRCRLPFMSQVEHPVTEGITDTNIPSIQLMIGMGIPLWRIPGLRASFNKEPSGNDFFDIETTPQRLPAKHVVAVRITSENAGDGFKPTAGRVDEVREQGRDARGWLAWDPSCRRAVQSRCLAGVCVQVCRQLQSCSSSGVACACADSSPVPHH